MSGSTAPQERPAAWVTRSLNVSFCVLFIASRLDDRFWALGVKDDARILSGEVWRLVTASFLHGNLAHLLFNAFALGTFGPAVERMYGRVRFLLVFVLGGVAGFALSVVFQPAPSVGASAGIFALLGTLVVEALRFARPTSPAESRRQSRRILLKPLLTIVGLNLVLGLSIDGIDNAAHLGGLLGGFGMGFVLQSRPGEAERWAKAVAQAAAIPKGRTNLGWAGQRWRLVLFWSCLVAAFACFYGSERWKEPLLFLLALVLLLLGLAVWFRTRCPRCRKLVVWEAASKRPIGDVDRGMSGIRCPYCRFPDTQDVAEGPGGVMPADRDLTPRVTL